MGLSGKRQAKFSIKPSSKAYKKHAPKRPRKVPKHAPKPGYLNCTKQNQWVGRPNERMNDRIENKLPNVD